MILSIDVDEFRHRKKDYHALGSRLSVALPKLIVNFDERSLETGCVFSKPCRIGLRFWKIKIRRIVRNKWWDDDDDDGGGKVETID